MHILIAAQYFWPESIGAAVWLYELARDLVQRGHRVTMVTAFPNYPEGRVFDGYRKRWFLRGSISDVEVIRTYIYATPSKSFWQRALSFGSFCLSASFGFCMVDRPDVIYAVLPPLPLGLTAELSGAWKGAPVVVNVQDIHPDIAVSLGYLKSRAAIRFFQGVEQMIYRRAAGIVVITESFRDNLLGKGVPCTKIHVIPNWADSAHFRPGPRANAFREELNANGEFLVIYSGGMGHNTCLDPVIEAARLVADEPIQFALIGDGVHRPQLEKKAESYGLRNVSFLPFQPAEKYPEVLAASDVQLVTLNDSAAQMSLPSKVLKIMASGRPVVALASAESDLARLVHAADCGAVVDPADPHVLAQTLRRLAVAPDRVDSMGHKARSYFVQHFDREHCVGQIEQVLRQAAHVR